MMRSTERRLRNADCLIARPALRHGRGIRAVARTKLANHDQGGVSIARGERPQNRANTEIGSWPKGAVLTAESPVPRFMNVKPGEIGSEALDVRDAHWILDTFGEAP